jgi:hypothetical protein
MAPFGGLFSRVYAGDRWRLVSGYVWISAAAVTWFPQAVAPTQTVDFVLGNSTETLRDRNVQFAALSVSTVALCGPLLVSLLFWEWQDLSFRRCPILPYPTLLFAAVMTATSAPFYWLCHAGFACAVRWYATGTAVLNMTAALRRLVLLKFSVADVTEWWRGETDTLRPQEWWTAALYLALSFYLYALLLDPLYKRSLRLAEAWGIIPRHPSTWLLSVVIALLCAYSAVWGMVGSTVGLWIACLSVQWMCYAVSVDLEY